MVENVALIEHEWTWLKCQLHTKNIGSKIKLPYLKELLHQGMCLQLKKEVFCHWIQLFPKNNFILLIRWRRGHTKY